MKIVDAKNKILGRMAAKVAKLALQGEEIAIINAESAVISGNSVKIISKYKANRARADTIRGPFASTLPDRIVRRTIRGMLPYKTASGRVAFGRITVFVKVPENLKGDALEIKGAEVSKLRSHNYIFVKDVSKALGYELK